MKGPTVFFYVQHLLGIGHLARASRIASALVRTGFSVTVVTGGTPVAGFPGPGVLHVALPEVRSGVGFSGLTDAAGHPIDDAFRQRRVELLLDAYRTTQPDIVMTEAFPFGRRQVRFELIPLLDEIHGAPKRPAVVASVRDILQERAKPGRDAESVALARKYYDHVLVHGDPTFVRLEDTFPLADQIADLVVYTGLVAPEPPPPALETFDVIVSAGGGAVGGALLRAGADAARDLPDSGTWALISRTNLPEDTYLKIEAQLRGNAKLFRFRQDFVGLLRNARLSISQAGYNTVCDLIGAGCRSILVPFAAGGETEQGQRAARLEKLGLAKVIAEEKLDGPSLAALVRESLSEPAPGPARLNLAGADATAAFLHRLV